MVPMMGNKPVGSRTVFDEGNGDFYLGMGLTAENVASDYKISREDQDAFAVESHKKALHAIENGLFKAESLLFRLNIELLYRAVKLKLLTKLLIPTKVLDQVLQ